MPAGSGPSRPCGQPGRPEAAWRAMRSQSRPPRIYRNWGGGQGLRLKLASALFLNILQMHVAGGRSRGFLEGPGRQTPVSVGAAGGAPREGGAVASLRWGTCPASGSRAPRAAGMHPPECGDIPLAPRNHIKPRSPPAPPPPPPSPSPPGAPGCRPGGTMDGAGGGSLQVTDGKSHGATRGSVPGQTGGFGCWGAGDRCRCPGHS